MRRVVVIGVPAEGVAALPAEHRELLAAAGTVAAGSRHLAALGPLPDGVATIEISADLTSVLDGIGASATDGGSVVVLASGDPGFFGIGRLLAERLGPDAIDVRPAASLVASAFGRLGLPWDDAVVTSAHGRPLEAAVAAVLHAAATKAAVLTSPAAPPQLLGRALVDAGAHFDRAVVLSEIGTPTESVQSGDLAWLAAGDFSPLSIVVLTRGDPIAASAAVSWPPRAVAASGSFGRHEDDFEHRGGMITKSEVRAVVLGRLQLPPLGVLWDVGAGSGSVGIEASLLQPGLRVIAVERDGSAQARIASNADRLGASVEIVDGEAPQCLSCLPSPDRVVLGGGGPEVLDTVLGRLRPGGRVVAMFAALERAVAAAGALGNLAQLSVSRGKPLPDGALRLVAADPVFVVWGPGRDGGA